VFFGVAGEGGIWNGAGEVEDEGDVADGGVIGVWGEGVGM
jgi:hypothetical protein